MQSEGTPHPGGRPEVSYGERAETYLRLLTEAGLRSLADEDITRVEQAADVLNEAGVLSSQLAARILAGQRVGLRPGGAERTPSGGRGGARLPAGAGPGLPAPDGEPIAITIRAAGDGPAGLPAWQLAEG